MNTSILLIDNYDSFTYNLHHLLCQFVDEHRILVKKNDQVEPSDVEHCEKIMISPGPGIPDEAGNIKSIIDTYQRTKDILGICLGLQAIAEVFGGKLKNLDKVYHGVSTHVEVLRSDLLFHHIPKVFEAGRYHSWVMDHRHIPDRIEILAEDQAGEIMALKIKDLNVRGVQFHPESILTPHGKQLIKNWVFH